MGDELGGHIVSGHVDGLGRVAGRHARERQLPRSCASSAPAALARFIAAKGSVAIDGVSLTVNEVDGRPLRRQHHPAHLGRHHASARCSRAPPVQPRDRHAGPLRGPPDRDQGAAGCLTSNDLKRAALSDYLCSAAELIEEARAGRMFILVDDEDRENEGDLVIPAQFATPDAINFMARHARGLICLALTGQRVEQLGLPLMSQSNGTRTRPRSPSRSRRARASPPASAPPTAPAPSRSPSTPARAHDIVTPGHVFPLMARDGGTLVRAGHTEAAVDLARLAGLTPAGVICEIMNDDGTMARLPDLVAFAQHHNLKLGTIADLIGHRRRTERLVRRVEETGSCTTPSAATGA